MPLRLELLAESTISLDVRALNTATLCGMSAADVARSLIWRGNKQVPLGDFFKVSGSAADDQTII